MSTDCPLCNPEADRVFLRLEHVIALWETSGTSRGHALIVARRHIPTWFEANHDERAAIFGAIEAVCSIIRTRWGADGFNIGLDLGEAAGQTIPHLHLHVVPRRLGELTDPHDGRRHGIPTQAGYQPARR